MRRERLRANHARLNRTVAALALLSAVTIVATPAPRAADKGTPPATDLQDVKREGAEMIETLKGYTAAQREQALVEGRKVLAAMDARIDALEARGQSEWSKLGDSARKKRQAALQTLRAQRREVAEWYGGMKHASGGAWEDVKQGFVKAYGTLSDAFGDAAAKFGRAAQDAKK